MREVIERLEALLAKATPGPWQQAHRQKPNGMFSTEVYDASGATIAALAWHGVPVNGDPKHLRTDRAENAALIAEAINALPALLRLARAVEDAPESGVVLYERVAGSPDCYAMVNAPVELAGQRVRLLPWGGV